MLLFLHLPKTAGTSLRLLLERVYGKDHIFQTYNYRGKYEAATAFKTTNSDIKARTNVIAGHFEFGLHDLLEGEHKYITFFREPVDRVVSTYYFMQGEPSHYLYRVLNDKKMKLRDFLNSDLTTEVDNGLTRSISGLGGTSNTEMLETAKANLKAHFQSVGFTESFSESVVLLGKKLGWQRTPLYTIENTTPRRLSVSELNIKDRDAVYEHCQLDILLYAYAREIYLKDIESQGPSFRRDVTTYEGSISDLNEYLRSQHARLHKESSPSARYTEAPIAALRSVQRSLAIRTRLRSASRLISHQ